MTKTTTFPSAPPHHWLKRGGASCLVRNAHYVSGRPELAKPHSRSRGHLALSCRHELGENDGKLHSVPSCPRLYCSMAFTSFLRLASF
jgi:hypothetical protein